MTYIDAAAAPLPLHIVSTSRYGAVVNMFHGDLVNGAAWPANNRALYVPVRLPMAALVARMLLANAGNITGNVDLGVYDEAGTRLTSAGSTARSGVNTVQYLDVTHVQIGPGVYYLGIVASSTVGTFNAIVTTVAINRIEGVLAEDLGATTLPATMTGVTVTQAYVPVFGFTQSATL